MQSHDQDGEAHRAKQPPPKRQQTQTGPAARLSRSQHLPQQLYSKMNGG
jgi:hypothetical protein